MTLSASGLYLCHHSWTPALPLSGGQGQMHSYHNLESRLLTISPPNALSAALSGTRSASSTTEWQLDTIIIGW